MYNLNKNLVYEFDLRNTLQFSSVQLRLSRIVIRVVLSQKGIFYFFDKLRAFHEIFSGKVYFVNYVIPVFN